MLMRVFLSALFTLTVSAASAQAYYLPVSIRTVEGKKRLDSVSVTIAHRDQHYNPSLVKDTLLAPAGKVMLKAPMDSFCIITVSRKGYISQRIEIRAFDVPYEGRENNYKPLELTIDLLRIGEEMLHSREGCCDVSIYNQPVYRVKYDPATDEFANDNAYTNSIKNKFKEARERLERVKKYNAAVREGDASFAAGSCKKAIAAYEKALRIYPAEYPQHQIKKCRP